MRKRKHIRLRDFSYASANAYFITVCTKGFSPHFGEMHNGIIGLSEVGNCAAFFLQQIPSLRAGVLLDEWIVMPNHLHCILELTENANDVANSFQHPVQGSVSVIINQYKGAVTKWCKENGFKDFEWQPRFYDHVIRDDRSYEKIRNYIATNTYCWDADRYKF